MARYNLNLRVGDIAIASSEGHKTLAAAQCMAVDVANLAASCFSSEILGHANIEIEDRRGRLIVLMPVSHVLDDASFRFPLPHAVYSGFVPAQPDQGGSLVL